MRLIFCASCKTLEECPDYDGPMEKDEHGNDIDPLIEGIVLKHNQRDPMAHGGIRTGQTQEASPMRIAVVDDILWLTDRENVLKQINESNKKVGFDAWVYEAVNTYQEDALRCYSAHHRPKEGCIDYRDESKLIGRPTEEGKKNARTNFKLAAKGPAICDYCPVHSWVTTQVNWRAGLYRDK